MLHGLANGISFQRHRSKFKLEHMRGVTEKKPMAVGSSLTIWVTGYLVAVIAVGMALAIRLALDRAWGNDRAYFTFYLAVIVTMCVAGGGPGLLATLSGLLLGTWFFVTPRHSLAPALAGGWANVTKYLGSGAGVLGQKGMITDCNDQVSAIVGYSRSELIGKPVLEFLVPEQRERVLRNVRDEREAAYELDLICKDGARRRVEAHGRSLRGSDGHSLRVSVIRDITEQKQKEEALRRQAALIDLSP